LPAAAETPKQATWPVFDAAHQRSIGDSASEASGAERRDDAMRINRAASDVDVVIVGAGQAGLTVSYYLRAYDIEHVVLERDEIAESWRSARWDSFTLVTPNWMTRLPGVALASGTAGDFLPRGAVVGMLERFARGLPVHTGTGVLSVTASDRGYTVVTTSGPIAARAVVVAGGGQRCPVIPGLASGIAADIHQSDAAHYRSPAALPPGAVLVVGSGQSGAQIASELVAAGREVLLATSRVPRVPRRYRGRDVHEWTVELGLYDQPADAVADPAELREPHPMLSGARGGHTISYQQLARDGVRLLGRLVHAEGHRLRFGPELAQNMQYADERASRFRRAVDEYVARAGIAAPPPDTDPAERAEPRPGMAPETLDTRAERIATVIWCTGFGPDTGWLRVPVLTPGGAPAHTRGVTAFPGLYVAGYPWLSNRGSGILYGVAADAARIAQHIAADAYGRSDEREHSGRCGDGTIARRGAAPGPADPGPGDPLHDRRDVPVGGPARRGDRRGVSGAARA
jgi:putative flavoprotein involved in K+ transport